MGLTSGSTRPEPGGASPVGRALKRGIATVPDESAQSLRKTPHKTRPYLLTDGAKRANLLGSMYARVEDASQRLVYFCMR